jgi:hypothetical protein
LHCKSHGASSALASVSHLATNPACAPLNSASSSSESEMRLPSWVYRTSSYLSFGFAPAPGFLRTPELCLLLIAPELCLRSGTAQALLGIGAYRPIWAQLTRRRRVSAAEYAPGVAPMTKVARQRMWSVPQSRPLLASIPRVATRR